MANRYGLQIRAARGADAPDLLDLMRAYTPCSAVSLASRLDAVDQSGAGVALVAVEWGPPTGLIAMHWFPTLGDDLPVAQIDILLVSWDERRRGVGRLLLKSASRMARTVRVRQHSLDGRCIDRCKPRGLLRVHRFRGGRECLPSGLAQEGMRRVLPHVVSLCFLDGTNGTLFAMGGDHVHERGASRADAREGTAPSCNG